MSQAQFHDLLADLTSRIAGRALDSQLDSWLNEECGVGTTTYRQVFELCKTGRADGWLCEREAGGIRYGRVFKPSPELHGFSVDVVDMDEIAGPHHTHPNGEIDLVMPLDGEACFDGRPSGWVVYSPGSAHRPTVTNGRALILYLLPQGRIEFTR